MALGRLKISLSEESVEIEDKSGVVSYGYTNTYMCTKRKILCVLVSIVTEYVGARGRVTL